MRFRFSVFAFMIAVAVLCADAPLYADSSRRDGLSTGYETKSRYFKIEAESGVNLQMLAMRIAVPSSIRSIIKQPISSSDSLSFEDQADNLFLAVSAIMDINLKNFKSNIKICENSASLSRVAMNLFGRTIQPKAFYVVALDTLYVDAESVSIHIMGHEMSHAIQTHYFVVPTPEKIQEVLAGFVEYELRKYVR